MSAKHRKNNDNQAHMIGELFTFAVFGAFLVLSLLIVVIGADGYRSVVGAGESVSEVRTTLGYVAGKLRSDAASSSVRIEQMDGLDTLVLTEDYDGNLYETIIYHQDGALHETYIRSEDVAFDPQYGIRLNDVTGFDMQWAAPDLLALTATASDGRTQTLHVAMRAGQGVTAP